MNQKESNLPMIGGIIAALGAGVCCVGPLLLLLLGVSGSWIGNLYQTQQLKLCPSTSS